MTGYINISTVDKWYTLYDNQSYKKASAISTLKQIESIIVKELSNYNKESNELEQLRKSAKYIHDGFLEKSSKLSSFKRLVGRVSKKEKEVEAVYRNIENLINPSTIFKGIPNETTQKIFSFLPTSDYGSIGRINKQGSDHARELVIILARKYGYQGNDYQEAKKHLNNLFSILNVLIKEKFITEEFIIYQEGSTKKIHFLKTLNYLDTHRQDPILQQRLDDALFYTRLNKTTDCWKLLLNLGANPNCKSWGLTPLLRLLNDLKIYNVHEINEKVALLLNAGADPNICDGLNNSPLHYACNLKSSFLVSLLIKHNTNVNLKGFNGNTALISLLGGYNKGKYIDEIATLLLQAGTDPNIVNNYNETALHYAACFHYPNVVSLLLNHNASIDAQDHLNRTPLHFAAFAGNIKTINILLYYKANKSIPDYS